MACNIGVAWIMACGQQSEYITCSEPRLQRSPTIRQSWKLPGTAWAIINHMFDFELIFGHCVQKSFTIAKFFSALTFNYMTSTLIMTQSLRNWAICFPKLLRKWILEQVLFYLPSSPLIYYLPRLVWVSVVHPFLVPHGDPLEVHITGRLSIHLCPFQMFTVEKLQWLLHTYAYKYE